MRLPPKKDTKIGECDCCGAEGVEVKGYRGGHIGDLLCFFCANQVGDGRHVREKTDMIRLIVAALKAQPGRKL